MWCQRTSARDLARLASVAARFVLEPFRTMHASWWLSVVCGIALGGCTGIIDDGDSSQAAVDRVLEPVHGAVVTGRTLRKQLRVRGEFHDATRDLAVQVLADPSDLDSWVTLATTRATEPTIDGFAFTVEVTPVATGDETIRWPAGGILRLRVIAPAIPGADEVALPFDREEPSDSVLAIVSDAAPPRTWTFLEKEASASGSVAETEAYYRASDAPLTLEAFKARYGFPVAEDGPGATRALYYNAGDLGIARDMHCRAQASTVACYVRNFGEFGGDSDEAFREMLARDPAPLATVAMTYTPPITAPNAVTFVVYGATGELATEAQLDTRGDNVNIPQNCMNCHGGRSSYDAAAHAVRSARFLPFDPAAFAFSERRDLTLEDQQDGIRTLNRLIADAEPTAGVREMVDGMFAAGGYDETFVPPGWNARARDARLYREVVAPYCRSCHAAFDDAAAFLTAADFRSRSAVIASRVCGAGPRMPSAEATARSFYGSSARALLLTWLDVPGACAP
jgi:hypothetical protein